jgi:hypothetical protein
MLGTSFSRGLLLLMVAMFASLTVPLLLVSAASKDQTLSSSREVKEVDDGTQGMCTCLVLRPVPSVCVRKNP